MKEILPIRGKLMKKYFTIPNCITLLRMVSTVIMAFLEPLSKEFFAVYTFAGITDILDGFIARITKTVSKFGAKLDSVADLLFYAVMLLKILPSLGKILPWYIWLAVGIVLLLRLCAYAAAAVKEKQFAAHHTILNKITGFTVFCVPYILPLSCAAQLCWIPCIIGGLASTEEILIQTTPYGNRYKKEVATRE